MTSGSGRAARYGPPPQSKLFGIQNKEGSESTEGIRDCGVISPSTPPQCLPSGHQYSPGNVYTTIYRRLDRSFVRRDFRTLYLPENRGTLLDVQPIQQVLPRDRQQLQRERFVFRREG